MAKSNQREIPAELARGRDRFTAWRRTRRPKARIPESLWELAVRLAATHGLNHTAHILKLDYYSLKKRLEAVAHREKNASAFIELPPVPAPIQECVLECEDGAVRLRVHLKGYSAAEIATVGRSFRDAL